MGSDTYTELNLGTGGSFMDETLVAYVAAPLERRRERVHIAGCLAEEITEVLNTDPSSTDYGLVVRNVPSGQQDVGVGLPGTEVTACDIVTVVGSGSETTVVTYVVPIAMTFHSVGWVASGDVDCIYRFKIAGVPQMVARSSVASPTVQMSFMLATPLASAGESVTITAEHFATGISAEFDGTILGYLT